MRILMLSDVYFPRVNGVSTSIDTFRQQLKQLGHEVVLVAPSYPERIEDDPDIIRVEARQVIFDPEDRLMKRHKLYALEEQLSRQQFDIIHIQTPFVAHYFGIYLAKKYQVPCIETYHTFFEEYLYHYVPILPKKWLKSVARFFSRKQCNAVNSVIVPSMAMETVLRDYKITTPMTILPTGIEIANFTNGNGARFRQQFTIDPSRPTLVFIGRVAHEKNIAFLITILPLLVAEFPDILLVVAGEGPAQQSLQKLTQQLHLENHVMFIGYLSRNNALLDCYAGADIFVFASSTETQGLVLLEAMAVGTPIVSTAAMGTVDILHNNPAAIIAELDHQDFANKVALVLRDPALRESLSQAGKQQITHWTANAMANRMVALYADMLSTRLKEAPILQSS